MNAVRTVGFGNAKTKPARNLPKKIRSGTTNMVSSESLGNPTLPVNFVADNEEESDGAVDELADNFYMEDGNGAGKS